MRAFGEQEVAAAEGRDTRFGMIAVLGSQRFDIIEIVPQQDRDLDRGSWSSRGNTHAAA
jgi:hypothetical protein